MMIKDWLVNDDGECEPRPSAKEWSLLRENYYFHRFLTEVVDILETVADETQQWDYLPQIRNLVRKLITNSYWLQTNYLKPDPKTGLSILTLYDEIGYPLTVETVSATPGFVSPIHNHGTWGVVALLKGEEKHTFWRRVGDRDYPDKIAPVGEKILTSGDIISFTPNAIHNVEATGNEPTVTFNLYGDTLARSRFEFNNLTHTAKSF